MSQQFLEIISQTFAAGETKIFQVSGQYFELLDAPYPVNVRLTDRSGAQRGLMTAAEASFFLRNSDFETIELVSPTAQTIRFMYGSAEAGTRRSAGVVSVVDSAYRNTLASKAFALAVGQAAGVGQFSHTQIFNNSALKNTVIKSISLSVGVASGVSFGLRNAALAGAGSFMPNKLAGGALSTSSRAYTEANAVDLLTVGLGYRVLDAVTTSFVEFKDPIVIPNGWGFVCRPSNFNTQITVAHEVTEEPT